MREESDYEYDVVLSFAGEDRAYVEQVATLLREAGAAVFYDQYEQVTLWGRDLYVHLDEVYRHKARFCVMFISRAYREKLWTNHERQSAQARAFQESEEYILPARFDDTEIPGIRPTIGYIDLRKTTPAKLAALVLEKLGLAARKTPEIPSTEASRPRKPRLSPRAFNPYEETLAFMGRLLSTLKRRCDELAQDRVSATVFERGERKSFRVVVDGTTVYSLDVWMGGFGGDRTIQFHGGRGEFRASPGSHNAWGELVWDKQADGPVLDFSDLSLLGHLGQQKRFLLDDFTDALWEQVCDAIEEAT